MERMASLLDNTGILFKLHTEVRANNLPYHSNCLKTFQYHYEMFLKKKKKNPKQLEQKWHGFQKSSCTWK